MLRLALRRLLLRRSLLLFALLPFAAACQSGRPLQPQPEFAPLEAPAPSPPGNLSLDERMQWWEDRIPHLPPDDRSEAYLRLGDLRLEAGLGRKARVAFMTAQRGLLSRYEEGRVQFGIAKSYLLEHDLDPALGHLAQALPDLQGPAEEEARFLYDHLRGLAPVPPADPAFLARLRPYLGDDSLRTAGAQPAAMRLVDLRRTDWGARPTRSNHDPMGAITRITIHHSAEPFQGGGSGATASEVRNIQTTHMGKGWADIGYHFLIDSDGRVIEGRPLRFQGAHAGRQAGTNFNAGNVGICLLGNFAPQPKRGREYASPQAPSTAQLAALEALVDALRRQYRVPRSEVHGHGEFMATECPGPYLRSWVTRYRNGLAALGR